MTEVGAVPLLENIRVVDFSRILAGSCATQILGGLGADVIKVEPPGGEDSDQILTELGYGEAEVTWLWASGAVA